MFITNLFMARADLINTKRHDWLGSSHAKLNLVLDIRVICVRDISSLARFLPPKNHRVLALHCITGLCPEPANCYLQQPPTNLPSRTRPNLLEAHRRIRGRQRHVIEVERSAGIDIYGLLILPLLHCF